MFIKIVEFIDEFSVPSDGVVLPRNDKYRIICVNVFIVFFLIVFGKIFKERPVKIIAQRVIAVGKRIVFVAFFFYRRYKGRSLGAFFGLCAERELCDKLRPFIFPADKAVKPRDDFTRKRRYIVKIRASAQNRSARIIGITLDIRLS